MNDTREREKLMIPCPYCEQMGPSHLGTCRLSLMRSGHIWICYALPVGDWLSEGDST